MTDATPSLLERCIASFCRRQWWWFAAWWLHVCLFHYFVLGFVSWDAMGYRGVPIVELLQHGSLGTEKYADWAMVGYTPFIELVHLPFLAVFGLRGFIMGFPLVVFPLCVIAIYKLAVELTGEKRSGTFAAFAYCAMPMINQQPFSGYVDFACAGILAYFLFAVIRISRSVTRGGLVRLVVASSFLGMARAQGMYIAVFMFPFLAYALFCTREGRRIRVESWRKLGVVAVAIFVGMIPTIVLQIYKYKVYGSPIAPMQFELLGIKIGTGVPMSAYWKYAGLEGGDFLSLGKGWFEGWIWHADWPLGAFYGSKYMGAGLVFVLALVLAPFALRRMTRVERWLLLTFVLVSLISKDFAVPRYGYGTMVGVTMIIGRALPALLGGPARWMRIAFVATLVVLSLHGLRPEVDFLQVKAGWLSPRMNVTASRYYKNGSDTLKIYPSDGYHFVIVDWVDLTLPIFGRRLSNEVIGSIPSDKLGPGCHALADYLAKDPAIVFIDQGDKTKACKRTCEINWGWYCAGWKIEPL